MKATWMVAVMAIRQHRGACSSVADVQVGSGKGDDPTPYPFGALGPPAFRLLLPDSLFAIRTGGRNDYRRLSRLRVNAAKYLTLAAAQTAKRRERRAS